MGFCSSVLEQLSEGKTLAPMIIIEITSSLSHCAWHRIEVDYMAALLFCKHGSGDISPHYLYLLLVKISSISTSSGKEATIALSRTTDQLSYRTHHLEGQVAQSSLPTSILENRTYMVLTGLHQSVPYMPARVLLGALNIHDLLHAKIV